VFRESMRMIVTTASVTMLCCRPAEQ